MSCLMEGRQFGPAASQHAAEVVFVRGRTGVTLTEVLVVVFLLAVLVGFLLPAVQGSRAAADEIACRSRMRQVALATLNYEEVFRVGVPASTTPHSLSRFLEERGLKSSDQSVTVFLCPLETWDVSAGTFSFVFCEGFGNIDRRRPGVVDSFPPATETFGTVMASHRILDGSSQTLLLSKRLVGIANTRDDDFVIPEPGDATTLPYNYSAPSDRR